MTGAPAAGNIADGLTAMARARPDALAALAPAGRDGSGRTRYVQWTFRQLEAASDRAAAGLQALGITPGTRTVLMVRPGLPFFALTFGLFRAGLVPVLVDPGLGIRNLGKCLAEAEPGAFVGISKAQIARRLFGWGRATIRHAATIRPDWPRGWPEAAAEGRRVNPPVDPDAPAAILFTSGSTGPPKGVVSTHAIFQAQVALLRDTYGIEPGEVDLCTFPLFALFGPILGMTCVVPAMDPTRPGSVDPTNIINPIRDFGVTNLFGSPALIRRVGDFGARHGVKLPSLRRVISAGAPVPARVLATFRELLDPGVEVFTPYGATESLPVSSIGSDEILGATAAATERGAGVCVGRPVAGMTVAIIRINDGPIAAWSDDLVLPEGTIGEVAVRGPVATASYFGRPEATALAKIPDPASGGFWHRMGDVGTRDAAGRIWFCGRKAHRVRTAEGTLFTIPCEGIFNAHPDVFRTALVGVGEPGRQRPVLCVERTAGCRRPWAATRAELLDRGRAQPLTRPIQTILPHPRFPVDIRHNAKIFRERLAVWAARKLGQRP